MYTYFFWAPRITRDLPLGVVKIGRTQDRARRFHELRASSGPGCFVLTSINGDQETVWHKRFKDLRLSYEWFKLTRDLFDAILDARDADDLINGSDPVGVGDGWTPLARKLLLPLLWEKTAEQNRRLVCKLRHGCHVFPLEISVGRFVKHHGYPLTESDNQVSEKEWLASDGFAVNLTELNQLLHRFGHSITLTNQQLKQWPTEAVKVPKEKGEIRFDTRKLRRAVSLLKRLVRDHLTYDIDYLHGNSQFLKLLPAEHGPYYLSVQGRPHYVLDWGLSRAYAELIVLLYKKGFVTLTPFITPKGSDEYSFLPEITPVLNDEDQNPLPNLRSEAVAHRQLKQTTQHSWWLRCMIRLTDRTQ